MTVNQELKQGGFGLNRMVSKGFTLIEVMVVVVILSILATFIIPKIMGRPDEARVSKVRADLRSVSNALELYRLDNYRYPTTEQGLEALVKKPTIEPLPKNWQGYLDRAPEDAWGRAYLYLEPGEHGEYDLYSLGADGETGGEGVSRDIGNWELE